MKKIGLLLLILILFQPIIVNACPHFDEDGNVYLLYYDSQDYETTIIEYPKNKYHQLYHYDPEDNLLAENFEIPFFTPMQIDYEVDIFAPASDEPYYIDFETLSVRGEKVRLDIDLEQTKEKLMPKAENDLSRLSYEVQTKLVTTEIHDNIYQTIQDYVADLPVADLELPIFYLGASKKTMDEQWRESEKIIRDFWDPVQVYYPIPDEIDDFTILQIDSLEREVITIKEQDFRVENDYAVFSAEQESYFQIVEKKADFEPKEIINQAYEENDDVIKENDAENNITSVIIMAVSGMVLFVVVLVILSKKQVAVS